jgi:hypothetical protein
MPREVSAAESCHPAENPSPQGAAFMNVGPADGRPMVLIAGLGMDLGCWTAEIGQGLCDAAAAGDRDRGALGEETLGDRATDAGTATGDQRGVPVQPAPRSRPLPRKPHTSVSNSRCRSSWSQWPQRPKTCSCTSRMC